MLDTLIRWCSTPFYRFICTKIDAFALSALENEFLNLLPVSQFFFLSHNGSLIKGILLYQEPNQLQVSRPHLTYPLQLRL